MKIIDKILIKTENLANITFLRIDPEDYSLTIYDIITTLADLSWINSFDKKYLRMSFHKRAKDTAEFLSEKLKSGIEDGVTEETGEYVVSELSRQVIVNELNYADIPLAELFKEKISGNSGFDFYTENNKRSIIFGEAKYISNQNAYGSGMKQVSRFIDEHQDISDLENIDHFFDEKSLNNVLEGKKGYAIGFSSKATSTDRIISGIKKNKYFEKIAKYEELIFVAVNI